MATRRHVITAALCTLLAAPSTNADIYRWDTGEVIPGTEGIEPGPGVRLVWWNTDDRNLRYADFSGGLDLTDASFYASWLVEANLGDADLTRVNLELSDLTAANLADANLTGANLRWATLTGVDFAGAVIQGAVLRGTTSSGFSRAQFESTASYQAGDLQEVNLRDTDLAGWNFVGQDLANANLTNADLTGTDLMESNLSWASFVGADLPRANLTDADLKGARFLSAELDDAILARADLTQVELRAVLRRTDLGHARLTNANLHSSTLIDTNLTGANLKNADLSSANIESAEFDTATVYNQWTAFPEGFDPVAAGLTYELSPVGDFNGDDRLDAADLYRLKYPILYPSHGWFGYWPDAMHDVNGDQAVDMEDHHVWIKDLAHTWYGDANLDGEFNSDDMVLVSEAGWYERRALIDDEWYHTTTWPEGDWNCDGFFDSNDFVIAFQDGGYEQGPRTDAVAVPEPGAWSLLMMGLLPWLAGRRRRCPD